MDCDPCLFLNLDRHIIAFFQAEADRRFLTLEETITQVLEERVRDAAIRRSLLEA